MIKFALDNDTAVIYDDTITENGWIVEYDSIVNRFLIWENLSHRNQGDDPIIRRTLEATLVLISSYT